MGFFVYDEIVAPKGPSGCFRRIADVAESDQLAPEDPNGNIAAATGPMAYLNPFRFSTKYHNDECGLVYYGYRDYRPAWGRWLSMDPVADLASLQYRSQGSRLLRKYWAPIGRAVTHPYRFLDGNPVQKIDPLGLFAIATVGSGPHGTTCGGYNWTVKFTFGPGEHWGFVVQHISSWDFHVHECPPSVTEYGYPVSNPYWELWQVADGQAHGPGTIAGTDGWWKPTRLGCKDFGTTTLEAEARFYPTDAGDQNTIPGGFTRGGVPSAKGLYSTYSEPLIWSESGYASQPHRLSIKWYCCSGAQNSTVVSHTP